MINRMQWKCGRLLCGLIVDGRNTQTTQLWHLASRLVCGQIQSHQRHVINSKPYVSEWNAATVRLQATSTDFVMLIRHQAPVSGSLEVRFAVVGDEHHQEKWLNKDDGPVQSAVALEDAFLRVALQYAMRRHGCTETAMSDVLQLLPVVPFGVQRWCLANGVMLDDDAAPHDRERCVANAAESMASGTVFPHATTLSTPKIPPLKSPARHDAVKPPSISGKAGNKAKTAEMSQSAARQASPASPPGPPTRAAQSKPTTASVATSSAPACIDAEVTARLKARAEVAGLKKKLAATVTCYEAKLANSDRNTTIVLHQLSVSREKLARATDRLYNMDDQLKCMQALLPLDSAGKQVVMALQPERAAAAPAAGAFHNAMVTDVCGQRTWHFFRIHPDNFKRCVRVSPLRESGTSSFSSAMVASSPGKPVTLPADAAT